MPQLKHFIESLWVRNNNQQIRNCLRASHRGDSLARKNLAPAIKYGLRDIRFLAQLLVLLLLTLSAPHLLQAEEEFKAQDIKIFTPTYAPKFDAFEPPLGEYSYKVAWQGIPAATVKVTVAREDGIYRVVTKAKTYSGIDLFYKLRYRAEGIVSAVDLSPIRTEIDHRENHRHKITRINFSDRGDIRAIRYRQGEQTEDISFNPKNFTLDPISASFLARGIDWKVGDSKQFDTFNGKSRYLITLTATSVKTLEIAGRERQAWEIVPKVENLTAPQADKKLREAKIYLSTDKSREVLQIVSSVFIGSVSTTMVKFKPELLPLPPFKDTALNFVSAKRNRQTRTF